MSEPNNRDPLNSETAELERNGEAIRADMDRTLHALEQKFSPGQLLDRSLQYVQEHGGQIAHEISTTVRHHPVPVLMAAGGLIWLPATVFGSRRSSRSDETLQRAAPAEPSSTYVPDGDETRLSRAQHKVANVLRETQNRIQQTGEQVSETVREQPLIFGALALAAGAVLGALLPTTEYERRTLGPAHDRAMGKAREFGDRQYHQIVHGSIASNSHPLDGNRGPRDH